MERLRLEAETVTLPMSHVKDEARKLLDDLPEDSTWDDILYAFYMQKKVERGLADLAAGRMVSQEEVETRYPSAS